MASRKYHNFFPNYMLNINMKNTAENIKEDNSNITTTTTTTTISTSSSISSSSTSTSTSGNNKNNNKIKIDSSETGSDSLPIHCIVESVSSMEDIRSVMCEKCDDQPKRDGKNWWKCDCKNIEMSGCVVVPEDTCINDFVKTVLLKLGYPSGSSSFAAGSILIRNWKPLPLRSICPEMNKSVGDILGELTAVVSLKIQIFRPKTTILEKIKDNLLNFLIKANQNFLSDSGCPFDTCTLAKFCLQSDNINHQSFEELSEEIQQKFDYWLKHNGVLTKEMEKRKNQLQPTSFFLNNNKNKVNLNNDISGANGIVNAIAHRLDLLRSDICNKYSKGCAEKEISNTPMESSLFNAVERPTRSTAAPKTRIRTSFDPELELPKLYKWYLANPHPSRQQILEYVAELNSLESRKGRKQLDINNVVYWFKNARAAQKRTNCRKISSPSFSSGNKGNVLKIPSGKTTTGNTSDDQRSVSDEEISVTSESGDDYQQDSDRCLQIVGKWNSNGQGEAVLEMQIASRKNDIEKQSEAVESKNLIENKETTKCKDLIEEEEEDNNGPLRQNSSCENNNLVLNSNNAGRKESQEKTLFNNSKNEISNEVANEEKKSLNGEARENEVLSAKMHHRNDFTSYKENNIINNSAFIPSYKPDFVMPPPNSVLQHSLMCVSRYMNSKPNNLALSQEERRKRNRTFIDPVTEVPRLEQWFRLSTHPSHNLISRYTAELNNMPYRRKFPKLETKNVQFWFKNRRAKNKRLNYLKSNK